MRLWLAALALMAACAMPACAQTPAAPPVEPGEKAKPVVTDVPVPVASPAVPTLVGDKSLRCLSSATQGGAILCKTRPGAAVSLDGKPIARADKDGLAVIGLTRSQKSPAKIALYAPPAPNPPAKPVVKSVSVTVAKRHDDVGSLQMDCEQISPTTPENQQKAADSLVKKNKSLETYADPQGPLGVAKPVEATDQQYSTSSFGRTRTYIPKTKDCKSRVNVHNGTDIAVIKGTEIRAPMAGTVLLADPDLYFEGGCIFLDLGRGMVSVTMHMSRIDVKPGQVVKQGELLGLSGATGRVTGPHVHWAIKYRNAVTKDRSADFWLDPMLVLKLDPTALM
jgi:murein DD-endopeptidase MepM/ murein hydrolase activator NlpD